MLEDEEAARRALGAAGEEVAARYLEGSGWEVLARNVRWRDGELDLVAAREEEVWGQRVRRVIFVEVKTRRRGGRLGPEANMTRKKRRAVARLAQLWSAQHGASGDAPRLDVIAVVMGDGAPQLTHYEGAFDREGGL